MRESLKPNESRKFAMIPMRSVHVTNAYLDSRLYPLRIDSRMIESDQNLIAKSQIATLKPLVFRM